MKNKLISFEELRLIREMNKGKTIVQCHGVFDLLHHGHFMHLNSAKKYGDILVVTITADGYVNKGPNRPYYNNQERAIMLSHLECIDYVCINNYARSTQAINLLKPDYYVKGNDYRNEDADITLGIIEEKDAVVSNGGDIIYTNDPEDSSTKLINKYFSNWNSDQEAVINNIKSNYTVDNIIQILDRIKNLKILVVGELLIDSYVYCHAQNIASKSPIISAKYLFEEEYGGGALAISNHLSALNCDVTLLTVTGGNSPLENYSIDIDGRINFVNHLLEEEDTLKKTRYIDLGHNDKLFELTHLTNNQWRSNSSKQFIEDLQQISIESDIVILADFGHGLFEGKVLEALNEIDNFIALNVQTNSGNLGFNLFSKHNNYDFLCLDTREYRLGLQNRLDSPLKMLSKSINNNLKPPIAMTLGPDGSVFIAKDGTNYHCPIFFEDVIDTTGAGDSYFLISSLLVYLDVDPILIPFLGNCHAGLTTRIIGNKNPVSIIDFIKTIKGILG